MGIEQRLSPNYFRVNSRHLDAETGRNVESVQAAPEKGVSKRVPEIKLEDLTPRELEAARKAEGRAPVRGIDKSRVHAQGWDQKGRRGRRVGRHVWSLLNALEFPTNGIDTVIVADYDAEASTETRGYTPEAAYGTHGLSDFDPALRYMWYSRGSITGASKDGFLATTVHEMSHAGKPFSPENAGLYGGLEKMLEVANMVIRIANQCLETGVYLNGYHQSLGEEYLAGEIDGMTFAIETHAIVADMYVMSRSLKKVPLFDAAGNPVRDAKGQVRMRRVKAEEKDWYLRAVQEEQKLRLEAAGKGETFVPLVTPEGSENLTGAEAIIGALLPEDKRSVKGVRKHMDGLIRRFGGRDPIRREAVPADTK